MAALLGEAAGLAAAKSEEQDDARGGNNAAAAPDAELPDGKAEVGASGGGAAPMDVDLASGGGDQQQQEVQQGAALQAAGSSAVQLKQEQADEEQERQAGAAQPPPASQQQQQQAAAAGLPPKAQPPAYAGKPQRRPSMSKLMKTESLQPSSAGVSQSGADGGTETEAGAAVEQGPQPIRPVSVRCVGMQAQALPSTGTVTVWSRCYCCPTLHSALVHTSLPLPAPCCSHTCIPNVMPLSCLPSRPAAPRQVSPNDDMDDSDAEHTYLREKRMRRPARLWRTARERAVWLRMLHAATSADQAAYCAYIMCDRCAWLAGWLMVGA